MNVDPIKKFIYNNMQFRCKSTGNYSSYLQSQKKNSKAFFFPYDEERYLNNLPVSRSCFKKKRKKIKLCNV